MKINSKSALTTSKKYFILSVVLLPLLFQYATPISSFTVGDAFMVFSWVYLMISTKKTKVKKSLSSIYCIDNFCLSYGWIID